MTRTAIAAGSTTIIVGGGLSGSLCALHFLSARPDLQIRIIERGARLGPGVAYGACSEHHLLNVPVSRLDVKAPVSFEAWLARRPDLRSVLADALAESGGQLGDAFVPRHLFGVYVEEQLQELVSSNRVLWHRGDAVSFLDAPRRGVLLADGREIEGDAIVLALGNLPPKSPAPGANLEDMQGYIPDPWSAEILSDVAPNEPVALIGTGLTMVDVALALRAQGHTGDLTAVSRRGLLPSRHAFGGHWPAFMSSLGHASPSNLLRLVRAEIEKSEREGVPWQRVIDSIRPFVARIWRSWQAAEKRSFLRHLRPRWDVVRHRMAPRVADTIDRLVASGRLKVLSGRIQLSRHTGARIAIGISAGGVDRQIVASRVINCTGPRSDYASIGAPLAVDARRRGLIQPDALGLGIETENCAAISLDGATSNWLFAIGALTRPAWWEITAAPEINAQVLDLAAYVSTAPAEASSLADRFLDLGAGI